MAAEQDAALQAALQLRTAAAALEQARDRQRVLGAAALEHWDGRYGREFAARLEQLQRSSADLQARLLGAATTLERAAAAAADITIPLVGNGGPDGHRW